MIPVRSDVISTGGVAGPGCASLPACRFSGGNKLNEVLRVIHERKSVRAFEERPIAPEDKKAILQAAIAAPSASNQQLTTLMIS